MSQQRWRQRGAQQAGGRQRHGGRLVGRRCGWHGTTAVQWLPETGTCGGAESLRLVSASAGRPIAAGSRGMQAGRQACSKSGCRGAGHVDAAEGGSQQDSTLPGEHPSAHPQHSPAATPHIQALVLQCGAEVRCQPCLFLSPHQHTAVAGWAVASCHQQLCHGQVLGVKRLVALCD